MTATKRSGDTNGTVTLKRSASEESVRAAEHAADMAAVEAHRSYEENVGWPAARRDYLTLDEARRLLDGENPVRVWREKRGMSQDTLAEATEMAPGQLADIEAGNTAMDRGSLERIGKVLHIPVESLVAVNQAKP